MGGDSMNGTALILFFAFGIVQVGMYLSIRRGWLTPVVTAGVGIFASAVLMLLLALAQGNSIVQAVFAALIVGAGIGGGVLAMAWYFHTNEVRRQHARAAVFSSPPEESV